MNTKIYDIITERIISQMKDGVCPWRRPWNRMPLAPQNYASGREYSGINMLLLTLVGYEVPLFLTFKQVAKHKGTVKKGATGIQIIYWAMFDSDELDENGDAKKIPVLRYYTVFNASQIDGIDFPRVESRTGTTFRPVEIAEALVARWINGPRIFHGFQRACYMPAVDVIQMPSPGSFDDQNAYYATLFHELGHATGAAGRLSRKLTGHHEIDDYSREELVAEMTSAFLCAHCGIDNDTIPQQAAYLAGWLSALANDPKMVIQAAAQAQKATNFILSKSETATEQQPKEKAA